MLVAIAAICGVLLGRPAALLARRQLKAKVPEGPGERFRTLSKVPIPEVVLGLLFALAVWKFDVTFLAVAVAGLSWALVVLSIIDLDSKLLPNQVVYPTLAASWVLLALDAAVEDRWDNLRDAGVGALIFGGIFFVIAFLMPKGMGMGDVKLAFVLGTFLGYVGGSGTVVAGMFLGFLFGGVAGAVWMRVTGGGRKTAVPFGPFLALGAIVGIYLGSDIVDAYKSLL